MPRAAETVGLDAKFDRFHATVKRSFGFGPYSLVGPWSSSATWNCFCTFFLHVSMATPNRLVHVERGLPKAPKSTLFDRIYEQRFDDVLRWVRAFGVPAAEQEDLVQEIFIIVHRRLVSFDGRNLSAWLYRITQRRVRDFKRLAWVQHFLLHRRTGIDELDVVAEDTSEPLEVRQRRKLLNQLLSTLGESERATLVLFEMQGYSGKEIASMQGVALATVWTRIHRARKKLIVQLERRRRSFKDQP